MYKNKDLGKNGINLTDFTECDEYDCYFETMYEDELNYILKKYDNYLVCLYNSTWRGSTGCGIVNNICDAFIRSYDYSQTLMRVSKGNKACLLKEYHHDVPMGHDAVVVGLTEKEYEKLNNANFEDLVKFADKYRNI